MISQVLVSLSILVYRHLPWVFLKLHPRLMQLDLERPKRWGNNNKDEDNSPKNLNDLNRLFTYDENSLFPIYLGMFETLVVLVRLPGSTHVGSLNRTGLSCSFFIFDISWEPLYTRYVCMFVLEITDYSLFFPRHFTLIEHNVFFSLFFLKISNIKDL